MSAFWQTLNVRFAGRDPGCPYRCGRFFQLGRVRPKGSLAARRTEAPPYSFLQ